MLVTPFDKQPAFKQGIIDKDGKVLKKYRTLTTARKNDLIQCYISLFLI